MGNPKRRRKPTKKQVEQAIELYQPPSENKEADNVEDQRSPTTEVQEQALFKSYMILLELAESEEKASTDDSDQTEPVEATNKNQVCDEHHSQDSCSRQIPDSVPLSQNREAPFPPLLAQAKERIAQAESSGNIDLAQRHKRILKTLEDSHVK